MQHDSQTTGSNDHSPEIADWEKLDLSSRARNSLHFDGISSIEQIRILGLRGLLKLPTLGRKAAREVWCTVNNIILEGELATDE